MNDLNEYIEYYKSLPLSEKQEIIIDELKMLTTMTNKMCEQIGAPNEILLNREVTDVNNKSYNEDDFSEAIISYICSIKNSLSDFSVKLSEISENVE